MIRMRYVSGGFDNYSVPTLPVVQGVHTRLRTPYNPTLIAYDHLHLPWYTAGHCINMLLTFSFALMLGICSLYSCVNWHNCTYLTVNATQRRKISAGVMLGG